MLNRVNRRVNRRVNAINPAVLLRRNEEKYNYCPVQSWQSAKTGQSGFLADCQEIEISSMPNACNRVWDYCTYFTSAVQSDGHSLQNKQYMTAMSN